MKPMKLTFIMSALVAWLCAVNAQAQITLKEYEDKNIGGYESIVFEYEEQSSSTPGQTAQVQKARKEFDIQANNPFNKLDLSVKEEFHGGRKVYNMNRQSTDQLRNNFRKGKASSNGADTESNYREPATGTTHTFVRKAGDYALVSYNFFIYDQEGIPIDKAGRISTIYVLNEQGEILSKIEKIPTDAYGTNISENGKYLAYAYGEFLEYTNPGDVVTGFKIIDLHDNNSVYFEKQDVGNVSGISAIYETLLVAHGDESMGKVKTILDQNTGFIYDPVKFGLVQGYMKFMRDDGSIITISDLTRIK